VPYVVRNDEQRQAAKGSVPTARKNQFNDSFATYILCLTAHIKVWSNSSKLAWLLSMENLSFWRSFFHHIRIIRNIGCT